MKPTIAFFGTPIYSVIVLQKLIDAGYRVAVVVTKPHRPIGRKQIETITPVAQFAQKNHLPLYTPQTHAEIPNQYANSQEVTERILSYKPELIIAANYTRFIPMQLIKQTKFGGLNVHPSLLPSYKGPAPIPWAIMQGETKTGVTIVTLGQEFDEGHIVAQEEEPILPDDTTEILLEKLFKKGADLLIKTLPNYLTHPTPLLQREGIPPLYKREFVANRLGGVKESYAPRISRDTGFENWETIKKARETGLEAQRIYNKWRALHPWPGLWTKVKLKGERVKGKEIEKRLKILKVKLPPSPLTLHPKLIIDEVQLEGKKPEDFKEFYRKYEANLG